MAIQNLYISHQNFDWAKIPNANLLTQKNFSKSLTGNYATSIEDIGYDLIDQVVELSENVNLIDIDLKNFEGRIGSAAFARLCYKLLISNKSVSGFDWKDQLTPDLFCLQNSRQTTSQTIFVTGCSITSGVGVEKNQRFISLVASKLNLPFVDLSLPGSSISWQADKILRSDINANDIVIWGITNIPRVYTFSGFEEKHYTIKKYITLDRENQYWDIDFFHSSTQSFQAVQCIEQVKNFCKKISARLILVNLFEPTWIPLLYRQDPNFLDLQQDAYNTKTNYTWADYGTDGAHPGPKQHALYAEQILKFYNRSF